MTTYDQAALRNPAAPAYDQDGEAIMSTPKGGVRRIPRTHSEDLPKLG